MIPSHYDLVWFWHEGLVDLSKVWGTEQIVNARYELDDPKLKAVCFACGSPDRPEVAHILPRNREGSDDPSNLHVLCHPCHRESEMLAGEGYWIWFMKKPFIAQINREIAKYMAAFGVDTMPEFAAVCEQYVLSERSIRGAAWAMLGHLGYTDKQIAECEAGKPTPRPETPDEYRRLDYVI